MQFSSSAKQRVRLLFRNQILASCAEKKKMVCFLEVQNHHRCHRLSRATPPSKPYQSPCCAAPTVLDFCVCACVCVCLLRVCECSKFQMQCWQIWYILYLRIFGTYLIWESNIQYLWLFGFAQIFERSKCPGWHRSVCCWPLSMLLPQSQASKNESCQCHNKKKSMKTQRYVFRQLQLCGLRAPNLLNGIVSL